MRWDPLFWVAVPMVAGGAGALAYVLAGVPPLVRPSVGSRGLRRSEALADAGGFAAIEPVVRRVGGWIAQLRLGELRSRLEERIRHAGDPLGLSADELLALNALCIALLGALGFAIMSLIGGATSVWIAALALGAYLPHGQLASEKKARFKQIDRGLPAAIDLAALCMGAGLDFPGALRQITEKSSNRRGALYRELVRILQELELGRTRRQALLEFEERCPTDAVRDFVGAVVQAEEKGNPLAEVLEVQAEMLRMRRSVMAEEAAARAGVMMMGPLMLMFVAILLMLVGPFALRLMGQGF
ncbi:MAG: type II secretion system F family protein [Myxococcota bacterium]